MNYFASELKEEWSLMRQGRFTLDNLLKYVVENQIQVIPAKYYNDDAQVKYLDFGSLYTYCCHGSKELLVKRWLRERIAYVDSMMDYFTSQDDQVTIRMNKTGYVEFSVTPYIPLYFSVKWSNADGGTQTFKLKRGETKTFYYTSTTATDQEVIIYHAQYIKELGGLSNLRPSSCILANATKLNNVEIHSDKLYNVNVSNNKYLRRLDLSGCSTLGTVTATGSVLDVSQCKYLSYLNIYGTALTGVLLNTSGGSLKEIYYPKTIQEVQLIKQTLLETIGLPYGKNGSEIPTSLYTVNIQECPSVKKLNTSSNPEISKTWISMKYCQNLTIRNALDFETITLDGFQRLKVLRLENMFKLKSLGFDDMLPVGEASTLQYMGISYCPELIDITMNCTSNDYEITFAKGALLNLSGATKLNSISSNCVIHGLETIVLPLSIKHLYFTNEYGTGYSSIKNIWSSRCCEINEEGVLPVAIRYEDQDYIGMDLQGMKLNDIDLGALVNIPRAINFDLSPTTVNPNFNINRDGVEYPYLQPEGVLNLSNYTESLARFFNGVDLDKLEVVVENPLPQTDLSYCFYNSSFSNENLLSPILSNVSNINNLDYCFYKTTIKSPNIVNNISFENGTMNYTFGECKNITALNGFTVSSGVTSSIGLFSGCAITTITNTKINTNGSCSAIFKGCTSLTNASGLVMPNTSDISSAFEECTELTGMPFIEITDKITDISKLYYGCINIDNIDGMVFGSSISNSEDWINKEQILSANNVVIRNDAMSFEGWNNLRTCNNLLITSNVKTFENYFKDCINLTSITFNELSDFSNLVNMAYAFNNCSKLSSISISVPDKVTNISYLFSGCNLLTDISGMSFGSGITSANSWYPPNLTTANNITIKNNAVKFSDNKTLISCNNLTITNNVTTLEKLIYGCTSLRDFSFNKDSDLSKVTTIKSLMCGNKLLSNLDFSGFNLTSLDTMGGVGENQGFIANTNIQYVNFSNCIFGNKKISWIWLTNNCKTQESITFDFTNTIMPVINFNRFGWGCNAKTYFKFNGADFKYWTTFARMFATDATRINGVDFTDAKFSHITDFSDMFNGTGLPQGNLIHITEDIVFPSTATNVERAFYGCTKLTHIHSNWNNTYDNEIVSTDCYAGCTGITHCDGVDLGISEYVSGLDEVPVNWGGYGFSKATTGIYKIVIPSDNYNWYSNMADKGLLGDKIVNWGDGTVTTGESSHTYATAGTYVIKGMIVGNYLNPNWGIPGKVVTEIHQLPNGITYKGSSGTSNLSSLTYINMTGIKFGQSAEGFLRDATNLIKIDGLSTVDFSQAESIASMFHNCHSLENINISDIKLTERTVYINSLFENCKSLTSLDFSSWEGIPFVHASYLVPNCSNLTSITGLANWDTRNLISANGMFVSCPIKTIDLSNWNISKVSNMSSMFRSCTNLKTIKTSGWVCDGSVTCNCESMFDMCGSLQSIYLPETLRCWNAVRMFRGCSTLTSLPHFDMSPCTSAGGNQGGAFQGCSSLLSVPNYDWSSCKVFDMMFNNCSSITEVHLINMNSAESVNNGYGDGSAMFCNCNNLTTITGLNLSKQAKNKYYSPEYNSNTFASNCNKLENIEFVGEIAMEMGTATDLVGRKGTGVDRCSALTKESLMNMLNALKDYSSSSETRVVKMSSTNVSKLTSEDLAIATNKGWTIVTS